VLAWSSKGRGLEREDRGNKISTDHRLREEEKKPKESCLKKRCRGERSNTGKAPDKEPKRTADGAASLSTDRKKEQGERGDRG